MEDANPEATMVEMGDIVLPHEAAEMEKAAFGQLTFVIGEWAKIEQQLGTAPNVAACKLLQVMVDVLKTAMNENSVRYALMAVYELSHPEAMSFIQRNEAKKLLDQLSDARRKIEGKPAGLIIPGEGDGVQ